MTHPGTLTRLAAIAPVVVGALLVSSSAIAQQDNPRARWEAFYYDRAFPFPRIRPRALDDARNELLAQWPVPQAAYLQSRTMVTTWQSLGPEGVPIFIKSSGRISAIAVHPTNSNIIYIGGAQGGVWKTTNGGASWAPMTDKECSLAMGSIAIDPVDPNIVYAGTGEQHFSGDSYYGCGVLRSLDAGATWTQLGGNIFQTASGGARISRVAIDPVTAGSPVATTVLTASDFGLYRSTNSGQDWTQVLTGIVTDLLIDPTNAATWYAAVRTLGVFRSLDSGKTWTAASTGISPSGVGRINLAISPSNPAVLYASTHATATGSLEGIYNTTDGGVTWTRKQAAGASCASQCWYDMSLVVDPTDPNTVIFGGFDLYRSTDGGNSFANISGAIHVDHHLTVFDPQDPSTIYAANDGGIYKSIDDGATWVTLNANLVITQFYPGIGLDPIDPNIITGGTQDNGTMMYQGAPVWTEILGGDGGFSAIDFSSGAFRYAETQWTANSGFSGPRRSDNGGTLILKLNGINTTDPGAFIPPLVMDPSDPRTLYFGTSRLYRTFDRGELWASIGSSAAAGTIRAIASAPSDRGVVYAAYRGQQAQLWVTLNSGTNWALVSATLPTRTPTDIAVNPTDPLTAYVTFSGFGTGHVFKTQDAGVTWSDISANLPDLPVNAILIEPGTPTTLYAGTDLGIFISIDDGLSWAPFNDGLPLIAVFDLAANSSTGLIVAATHGRGMFSVPLVTPLAIDAFGETGPDSLRASSQPLQDSAVVRLIGNGANQTTWTAVHGAATWLALSDSVGTGIGRIRWTLDPAGLVAGTYVDTVSLSASGATNGPATIIDTFVVLATVTAQFIPGSRLDTGITGIATPLPDSATLSLVGQGATTESWTAQSTAGWVTVTTPSGVGSGTVRWERSALTLAPSFHVDTVFVTLAGGITGTLIDSLLVLDRVAAAIQGGTRSDTAFVGDPPLPADSVLISLTGAGADTASWTVTKERQRPWVQLLTGSGNGTGYARWQLVPDAAPAGPSTEILQVTVPATAGAPARIFQGLFVVQPPALQEAIDDLLNGNVLTRLQRGALDSRGNGDGDFNLGDVLGWYRECTSAGSVCSPTLRRDKPRPVVTVTPRARRPGNEK